MPFSGILFRTTDALKWGTGKGAPLTKSEVDLNFWDLLERMINLETNPPTAISISNISVIGSQMQVNMSDGSHFGPFTLPVASFALRGDYAPTTGYFALDLVSVPGQGLFLVKIPHTSASVFDPAAVDGTSGLPLYLRVFGEDSFIYDFGWFYPGKPGNGIETGGTMAGHVLVRDVTLPVGLAGSRAQLGTATTAALSFPLYKNTTLIGSVDFAAGATVGTFVFTAAVPCVAGDLVRLVRPTAVDLTAKELSITIAAQKN